MRIRPKPNIAALVAQMPDVDEPGKPSKFTGPDPAVAARVFEKIVDGGPRHVRELIKLARAPGDPAFEDYRAGYVLHGVVLYVGQPGKEKERRMVAEELEDAISGKGHAATRALLIRELQVAGNKEAVKGLGKLLRDPELCEPAAQALLAMGEGDPFRKALGRAQGRSRVTVIQALGWLRDARTVSALQRVLKENDREARMAAGWALANMGAGSAAEALLRGADTAEGWERIQATKACLLLAERLRSAGKAAEAARIYTHLRDTRNGPEGYIRDLAERALRA